MIKEDLIGKFSIIGSNQNGGENSYTGKLNLSLDENNRIIAKWLINKSQEQFGIGFFKDNLLVVNFHYNDSEGEICFGTVVYKCLTKDILEGFWSEDFGYPRYLGSENCFRINIKRDLPS